MRTEIAGLRRVTMWIVFFHEHPCHLSSRSYRSEPRWLAGWGRKRAQQAQAEAEVEAARPFWEAGIFRQSAHFWAGGPWRSHGEVPRGAGEVLMDPLQGAAGPIEGVRVALAGPRCGGRRPGCGHSPSGRPIVCAFHCRGSQHREHPRHFSSREGKDAGRTAVAALRRRPPGRWRWSSPRRLIVCGRGSQHREHPRHLSSRVVGAQGALS